MIREDARGPLPRVFWTLWVGTLINRAGGFVVPLLTFYLTRERGLGVATAGAIVALFGAGQAIAGLVGGELADRIGRRPTILLSLWGGALAMLGLGAAEDVRAIAGWTFALGLIGDCYRPAVSAVIADVVPERDRLRAFGLFYWAINLGFAIAPLLAGAIAGRSYAALFVGDAVTIAAFGAIVAWKIPETRPAAAAAPRAAGPARGWRGDRVFLGFLVATFACAFLPMQAFVPLTATMAAQGHGEATYGAVLAINGVLIVALQPWATRRLAPIDAQRVLAGAALVTGIGIAMHGLGAAVGLHAAAVAVWTLGEIAWAPVASTVVAGLAPIEARGRYQGAIGTMWGAASCAGPLLGGLVLERAGPRVLYGACAAIGLATAGFLIATADGRRRRLAGVA